MCDPRIGGVEPGLRERKKSATRTALHEAAVRLATDNGPDRLTVEAIADAATVSRRTFSNYFASKEEALLYGHQARVRLLLELVDARPAGESPWTALTRGANALTRRVGERDPAWVAQNRLILDHPTLLARQVSTYAAAERELAATLTARMPPTTPPLRPRLMAAAFLTALRVATNLWLENPSGPPLTTLIDQALSETARPFD